MDGDDDRMLLTRHAVGDRTAFATLVSRHGDRLWRIALRTLGDADDAAVALQDALVKASRSAAIPQGDPAATTWLQRAVVDACLDLARHRTARAAVPPAGGVPTLSAYDGSDVAATVLAALRRLPADDTAAVVLVDVEGLPVREAAEVLDVPAGTVKSRCSRARARLAVLLGDVAADVPGAQPRQGKDVP